jgi:hypothetical protein
LKQALRSANIVGVEKDHVDMLCQMFDAPRPLVLRILYASQYADKNFASARFWVDPDELPFDVRRAISATVGTNWRRVALRKAIEGGELRLARVAALVPEDKPELICGGCPKSFECIAESLHQPKDCRIGKGAWASSLEVRPIKINKNIVTVECDHPKGQFVLDVKDFEL